MWIRKAWRRCLLAVLCSVSIVGHSVAQPVADFYKGKQIQVLIGFGPGGSNDLWGRLVGRYIVKHLPGMPGSVPQNVPGAGSMRVANQIYNVAPKDGTVIGIIARGIPLEPLFKGEGAQFDAKKFTYLGTPTHDTTICAVNSEMPQKTPEDFIKYPIIVGSSGSGAETNIIPLLLNNVLGMKFKIITGFQGGGTDVMLAMERKEVQGVCFAYENLEHQTLYTEGKIRAAIQVSLHPDPELKNIPNVFDIKMTPDQRSVLDLIFVREVLGRPFVAPPDLPVDRAKALQDAFDETMKDPAFLADAKKLNLPVIPTSGKQLAKVVSEAYSASPELAAKAAAALGR